MDDDTLVVAAAMPESPSFLEQFDRSGLYATRRASKRPGAATVLSISFLVVLLIGGIVAGLWLFVFDTEERSLDDWLNEGLAAHVEGRLVDAAQAYQEVLIREPENKFAHYNLGVIAQSEGRTDDAEERYRRAIATDPSYEPALFNLAILRANAGDFREAVDLYRLVVSANPNNASAHLNLGLALQEIGQGDAAARELAQAIALDPTLRDNVEAAGFGSSATTSTTTTTSTTSPTTTSAPDGSPTTAPDGSPTTAAGE